MIYVGSKRPIVLNTLWFTNMPQPLTKSTGVMSGKSRLEFFPRNGLIVINVPGIRRSPEYQIVLGFVKNKMSGVHTVNSLVYGVPENQPHPPKLRVKVMQYFFKRMNLSEAQLEKWAGLLSFELSWWRDRGWLKANSLQQLENMSVADGFNIKERLLGS